jgi:hypothetical protein
VLRTDALKAGGEFGTSTDGEVMRGGLEQLLPHMIFIVLPEGVVDLVVEAGRH